METQDSRHTVDGGVMMPALPDPTAPVSPSAELTAPPGSALQIAQLLASGKIDAAQAGRLARSASSSSLEVARALHTVREIGESQPDLRTAAEKEADAIYGAPAKESAYRLQFYTPGQEPPVIPPEVKQFDANVRGWMADAGLTASLGTSLFHTLSKAIQHTHTMTAEQREAYKDAENLKLEKLFGPDWHDTKLKPVAVMIHELDQKRPGLKELVRAHGDHAMFLAQLIQAATIYHARKGR